MGMLKWFLGERNDDDDTEQHAADRLALPGVRMPIDLRRAQREQRRSTTGYWRDERGDWHQVEKD